MNEFYWIAVAVITIVSAARLTRLATWDKFPPVEWLRNKYADLTDGNGWQLLAFCGYCASFWITGIIVGWGWLAGVYDGDYDHSTAENVWLLMHGVLAASYAAAIVMANDGDEGDQD